MINYDNFSYFTATGTTTVVICRTSRLIARTLANIIALIMNFNVEIANVLVAQRLATGEMTVTMVRTRTPFYVVRFFFT